MCTKLSTVGGAQLQSPQHAMEAQVRAQSRRGTVAVAARKARAAAGAFRAPGTGLMHSELEHDLYFSRPWKCVDFEDQEEPPEGRGVALLGLQSALSFT